MKIKDRTFEWYLNEQRRGRGYKEPPERLAELLYLFSFVPPDAVLPDLAEEFGEYLAEPGLDLPFEREILKAINSLPEGFASFVFLGPMYHRFDAAKSTVSGRESVITHKPLFNEHPWSRTTIIRSTNAESWGDWFREFADDQEGLKDLTRSVIEWYSFLRESRQLLREIIRRMKLPPEKLRGSLYLSPIRIPADLEIDNNNRFTIGIGHLAQELKGKEATRIRDCKVCGHIYWAGRKDVQTCSRRCTNLFHTHRHRYRTDEEKAAYKDRRIKREQKRERSA